MSTTAVDRCLSVVEALIDESAGVSLVDLAARLEMPNSAIHRTLATLASRGYVRQDPATQAYALTLRLSTLGVSPARRAPFARRRAIGAAAPCRANRRVLPARGRRRRQLSPGSRERRAPRRACATSRRWAARSCSTRRPPARRGSRRCPKTRRCASSSLADSRCPAARTREPSARASCERSTSSAPISRKRDVAATGSPSKKASPASWRWRQRSGRARTRARRSPAPSASPVRSSGSGLRGATRYAPLLASAAHDLAALWPLRQHQAGIPRIAAARGNAPQDADAQGARPMSDVPASPRERRRDRRRCRTRSPSPRRRRRSRAIASPPIAAIRSRPSPLLLLAWQFLVRLFGVPEYILPVPTEFLAKLVRVAGADLAAHAGHGEARSCSDS